MNWLQKLIGIAKSAGSGSANAAGEKTEAAGVMGPVTAASSKESGESNPPNLAKQSPETLGKALETEIEKLRWHDYEAACAKLAELKELASSTGNYRIDRMARQGARLMRDPAVRKLQGGKPPPMLNYRVPMDAVATFEGYEGEPIVDASGCTTLRELPAGLKLAYLNLSGCTSLAKLPADLSVRLGRLNLRDCALITELPPSIGPLHELDLGGCLNITSLPETLEVTGWIDVAGSSVKALPENLRDTPLRWNGVPVDERIAFRPEEIQAPEVMAEANVERRRVLMERMGFERFIEAVDATVLDKDKDAGGPRKLLRVEVEDDEPLVCLSVICPSTQRHFMLRVPPTMKTCRQAVAWTAGYDDPGAYKPLVET